MAQVGARSATRPGWPAGGVAKAAAGPDRELLARFAACRDREGESAFRALVERHGPMVWNVCRRVLGDAHESEDAFQATFLILARKADRVRDPGLLGNWLYGVAYKVSSRARALAGRRRAREAQGAMIAMAAAAKRGDPTPDDLGPVLHEEIRRLPEKYRAPVVLCYLEGHSNEEAARRLGCPVGTVKVRMMRARERLRERLTRRGLALSALLLLLLLEDEARAEVPDRLVEAAVKAAVHYGDYWQLGAGRRRPGWRRWARLILILLFVLAALVQGASLRKTGLRRARASLVEDLGSVARSIGLMHRPGACHPNPAAGHL